MSSGRSRRASTSSNATISLPLLRVCNSNLQHHSLCCFCTDCSGGLHERFCSRPVGENMRPADTDKTCVFGAVVRKTKDIRNIIIAL